MEARPRFGTGHDDSGAEKGAGGKRCRRLLAMGAARAVSRARDPRFEISNLASRHSRIRGQADS